MYHNERQNSTYAENCLGLYATTHSEKNHTWTSLVMYIAPSSIATDHDQITISSKDTI